MTDRQRIFNEMAKRADRLNSVAEVCLDEIIRLRAIEAEVLQAQEPVVWFAFADSNGPVPLELWGFDQKACKNAVLENARSTGWKGTVEGYLLRMAWTIRPLAFIAPQPPAPCPKCRQFQDEAERLTVEAAEIESERDALQAKVATQSAEIERLTSLARQANQDHLNARLDYQRTIAQQAALIEKCEKAISIAAHSRIAVLRNGDPSHEGYPYRTDDEVAKIDGYTASLIEALSAISAHKS